MKNFKLGVLAALAFGAAALPIACSSDAGTAPLTSSNSGTVVVRLTDAPFLTDSLKSVDIFVVRVDARVADTDSSDATHGISDDSSATNGWKTIASPNASVNLLSLQNGVSTTLGQSILAPATYSGFRFIIDPAKSSVTLKDGRVLTGSSDPGIKFPSADKSGIKIVLAQPVVVTAGTTTTLLVDFNVNDSFVMRGNSIHNNGLLFKPVIKASVTNIGLTNATVRLVNATGTALNLLQSGTALSGGSNIAFGASSACSSVNATTPALTVTQAGSSTALPGFAPTFTVGNSFTVVAFPNATGGVQFATLANAFTPTAGQAGLRVFNATTATTGYDMFLTAVGAILGTPTVSNVLAGAGSSFISVPVGASQIRLTSTGSTTVLLDVGSQTFTAGQTMTLVIAPPAAGTTTPRAFLIPNC
jgi:hypothetical protein